MQSGISLRLVTALIIVPVLALTACQTPEAGPADPPPLPPPPPAVQQAAAAPPSHRPADLTIAGLTVAAQVAWLDETRLTYASPAGIEVLKVTETEPATLAGPFWRVSPAPDGRRIAYWGESGLGLAGTEPLQLDRLLWAAAGIRAWAGEQVGVAAPAPAAAATETVRWWVADIRWSPDGGQIAALLRAEGPPPHRRTASALAVFAVSNGDRRLLWGRSGQEGSIRAFRWARGLLVQYDNVPDGPGPHGRDATSTLLYLADALDPKVQKPMAGLLPYPLTLADVQGNTALFLPDRQDYTEPFPMQPHIASTAMVGVTPIPVGAAGQTGLLSPRDGQFIPLGPGQERAAISPSGDRLALLTPQVDGTYAIRFAAAPAAATGAIDLEHARAMTLQVTPAPVWDGPPPHLTAVAFRNEQEGFGVTAAGAVYRSIDGGATWLQMFQAEGVALDRILYVGGQDASAATLVATGRLVADSSPVLLVGNEDGRAWSSSQPQGLPANADRIWPFLNFTFPTAQVGFAVPDPDHWGGGPDPAASALLATRDGGRHWETLPLPVGLRTSGGISFVDPEQGFITAYGPAGSQILATTDGGRTWRAVYTSHIALYALQFLDDRHGFAGGGNTPKYGVDPFQYLLHTRNGGVTWEEAYRSEGRTGGPIAALQFSSPDTGWAATGVCTMGQNRPCDKGLVYTGDGGRTWQGRGGITYGWSTAGPAAWGVVGAPESGQAFLAHSADGGTTWQHLWHPEAVTVQAVRFTTARTGWIQANVGAYHTTDGGQTWQPTVFGPGAPAGAWPVFAGGDTAYLTRGRDLLRSQDGGRTWQGSPLPPAEPGGANFLTFTDPVRGWATYTGRLYATDDGGQSWRLLVPGLTDHVSILAFGDALRGVAGSGRHLLLTGDGGQNWSGRPLKDVFLTAADYQPDGHIWLTGQTQTGDRTDGVLLHSPDDGRTWSAYRSPSFWPFQVSFTSPTDGWITAFTGGHQALLVTQDGGGTWRQVWPALPQAQALPRSTRPGPQARAAITVRRD